MIKGDRRMTDHQKTVLDYAVRETPAESELAIAARLERCLSRAGYLPVLHVHDNTKPACPQGFFMMEYRRLDDPRFRAVTSLKTVADPDQALQVTFDTASLPRQRSWRGLLEAFRYRAAPSAPVTLSAIDVVSSYTKGGRLPNGEASASRYADLAYTLQHRTGHTFFIDPARIEPDFVIAQACIDPDDYKKPEARPSNNWERLLNKRRVWVAVPTQLKEENRGIYIRAEYALSVHDPASTPVQYVGMRQFSHFFPNIMAGHVRGDIRPSAPNTSLSAPRHF